VVGLGYVLRWFFYQKQIYEIFIKRSAQKTDTILDFPASIQQIKAF
jgi:hypothetical protein